MSLLPITLKTASISISLIASGGIAALTLFDIPELQSQPASRSLPSIRWLFSRGSHIFPTAVLLSSAGFTYLAVSALPPGRTIGQIVKLATNGSTVNGYLIAAALNFAVAPWTSMVMVPTNFRLIELNEKHGGARSQKSAEETSYGPGERSAEQSVDGKGDVDQFSDLSGPQTQTQVQSTKADDEEVRELLGKFGRLNAVRAIFAGVGGIAGLIAALT